MLDSVDKVLDVLGTLAGTRGAPAPAPEPAPSGAHDALERNCTALFGTARPGRATRIMVTLPAEAATDAALAEALVAGGMDIARINCAHGSAEQWIAMAENVRQASRRENRRLRVLMDLGGPKLRTGAIDPAHAVLKIKPLRDDVGAVQAPARLVLRAAGTARRVEGTTPQLGVDGAWLARLEPGDRIDLIDARGSARRLTVTQIHEGTAVVECRHTIYLTANVRLRMLRRDVRPREVAVSEFPVMAGHITLHRGDLLALVRKGIGHAAAPAANGEPARQATIACTLPEALAALRTGERIWFDDGRIGGVVRRRTAKGSRSRSPSRATAASAWRPTRASTCRTPGSICPRSPRRTLPISRWPPSTQTSWACRSPSRPATCASCASACASWAQRTSG